MSTTLRLVWTTTTAAAFCLALACQGQPEEGAAPSRTLVWGGPSNISMIPIIAEREGFFAEEGLDIKVNYVQTGKIAMDAVVSGDLDFGVIVETNIAFVGFQEGAGIKVIAAIAEKYDDAIVARRDAGIEKPKDLEGKTLAILPGTTSHRFADRFIEFYGLDRASVQFVNLTPPGIQAGILNASIPAGSVWQPYRYNVMQELGDGAIEFNDRAIYKAYSLVAVRDQLIRDHPRQVEQFLRALIRAERFIEENLDAAIDILAEEIAIEPTTLRAVWDEYDLRVQLDLALEATLDDEARWIIRDQRGFESRTPPSYASVVVPQFLQEIEPTRVVAAQD